MRKKVEWKKGPPPSIGWWPAALQRTPGFVRWWDGLTWSMPVPTHPGWTKDQIAEHAAQKSRWPDRVEWHDRPKSWPKRSLT